MSDDIPLLSLAHLPSSDSEDDDYPFAELPPELVEMIIGFMWRLEDQLLCRQVCKWWRDRVGMPTRYDNNNQPYRHYLLNQHSWATLSAERRVLRMMEFKPWGSTHLWEYSSGGMRVKREVIFRPPETVTEICHEYENRRRLVTTFTLRNHNIHTEVRHTGVYCSII